VPLAGIEVVAAETTRSGQSRVSGVAAEVGKLAVEDIRTFDLQQRQKQMNTLLTMSALALRL
jgi:hypothetical protein